MSGRKGMMHYSRELKEQVIQENRRGATPSMSRRGNCYDNAMAENFFSVLKTECFYRYKLKSFTEARERIDEYIYFYDLERFQLKYKLTPLEKRRQLA